MPITYELSESRFLSTPPDTYVARVVHSGTAELKEIIAVMVQQGCTMFESDIVGVLVAYRQAIESLLREGRSVNTEIAKYNVGISGVFTGSDDTFDPDRHQVRINVQPGKCLVQALAHAKWVKLEPNKPLPHLMHYSDVASGRRDGSLTPGGVGQINGFRLRFDPANPDEGIFFVAPSGTKTRVETMVKNQLRELIFVVPALPAGGYRLEVRARIRGGEELRTGALECKLTVA